MMILPTPRRANLIGFWCVLSLILGAIAAIAFLALGSFVLASGVLLLTFLFLVAGFVRYQQIAPIYMYWNSVALRYTRFFQTVLLRVCFFIYIQLMGRVGHTGNILRENEASLWVPRATLLPDTYLSEYDFTLNNSSNPGWVLTFVRWSIRSGRVWAIGLTPFLILISILSDDNTQSFPASIYTLF